MESIIRSVKKKDLVSLEELYSQSVENHENIIQNANLRAYLIYNKETTIIYGGWLRRKIYETERGAKMALTKMVKAGKVNDGEYGITDSQTFHDKIEKTVTKKSLMSGKEFTQPANTPLCCDPSSETYWSM